MPSSWVNTECSIHRVQHTPKIVCRPFILTISSWALNVANRVSAPGAPPIDRLQIDHLQVLLQSRSIIACKCISKLDRSRPPSAALRSLDLGLQVHLQTRSITASKCISQFTPSRALSASPNSLYHGLQVHLSVHSIWASKCISKLNRSRPPSAALSSLDLGL